MLDFFDLCVYFLAFMKHKEFKVVGTLESSQDLDNQKHESIVNFLKDAQIFQLGRINVSLLTDISRYKSAMTIKASEPFSKALEKFAEHGARRILLLKPKEIKYGAVPSADSKLETDDEQDSRKKKMSEVVGIISQADVVKFIHEHKNELPAALLSKTLEECKLSEKEVIQVEDDNSVIDALELMYDHGLAAIPMIDPGSKQVTGNISLRDIQFAFDLDDFSELNTSCKKYIGMLRRKQAIDKRVKEVPLIYSVPPTATIQEVVQVLVTSKTHHVWVVDPDKGECRSVISLSDIIKLFYREA
eukprot:TRINITY_DN12784_c0_g1_i1.p3 TRINITY_DN12784_c0_g1~~TRINITY_DN12784_c0_g1_i1.p3  ORF type:complete len:302 (-),score=84.49 TRINITY_DN12784_c0_g1_i1:2651-3556(-)